MSTIELAELLSTRQNTHVIGDPPTPNVDSSVDDHLKMHDDHYSTSTALLAILLYLHQWWGWWWWWWGGYI